MQAQITAAEAAAEQGRAEALRRARQRAKGEGAPGAPQSGMAGRVMATDIPARIGPVEFGEMAGLVAVRCPSDLDPWMREAGGQWEPGTRRSLCVYVCVLTESTPPPGPKSVAGSNRGQETTDS